ncbi:TetR/AcrR family transcriptional regulator [Paenactinomyces guangxiensis]|uniref:TetR/AcrR family transcriptional regulator n=1 Tax=Paenactinomyces guangxiensis TaxID=1490290 RepID=A0A7W2A7Z8_9BACL|nr:TetR/AcrR family transcriptional regulator [Paenactinomyces guangxiensis]MBA4495061.1 TetR/AcrR family transcriptional regulator [Paenactinomyces guangxiensis]MBH8592255.1 TetR/AcrR family transcriptional regulator [Paenactinomyces guangxiensis]
MGRKFSEHEKEYIRKRLLETGKNMFSTYGLKKTSIGDLTKSVGIAQGTFYLFFKSKEELYFEILEIEEERVRKSLLSEHFISEELTRARFKQFLKQAVSIVETNPIFRQIYEEDVLEHLMRKLPPEKWEKHMIKDFNMSLPLISHWQKEGRMVDLDPELIVSMIRSLILLTLQKKIIGEQLYQPTIELFIQFIADGLVKKEDLRHD